MSIVNDFVFFFVYFNNTKTIYLQVLSTNTNLSRRFDYKHLLINLNQIVQICNRFDVLGLHHVLGIKRIWIIREKNFWCDQITSLSWNLTLLYKFQYIRFKWYKTKKHMELLFNLWIYKANGLWYERDKITIQQKKINKKRYLIQPSEKKQQT